LEAGITTSVISGRWSTWEKGILSRIGDPAECQRVIEERQAAIDDDQTEADIVREGVRAELRRRGASPDCRDKDPHRERVRHAG